MTIKDFADTYDEWRLLKDWSLGPVIRPDPQKDPQRFSELTEILISQSDFDQIQTTNDGHFFAESAWHASFFLEVFNSAIVCGSVGNMLFRGQSDSNWHIVPSIDREDLTTFSGARKLFESLAFRELSANLHTDLTMISPRLPENGIKLSLPREAYVPVAQHYGHITELVDFTADPTVAVFFAANSKFASEEQMARVFASRLGSKEHLFDKIHLKLVPPFFRRPYLQKGVFVQSMNPGDIHEEYSPDLTIDFPANTIEKEFVVIRGEIVDILPKDDNIKKLSEIAERSFWEFLQKNEFDTFDPIEVFNFISDYAKKVDGEITPLYKPEVHKAMGYFAEFINELEDLFYWLCYFTNHKSNGGIALNVDVFDTLIDHNPEIMLFFAKMYKMFLSDDLLPVPQDENRKKWQEALSSHIYVRLENSGHNPSRRLTVDDFVK